MSQFVLDLYKKKLGTAAQAAALVKSGDKVFLGEFAHRRQAGW